MIPTREEVAAERFTNGFNCAQAVFSAYATAVGVPEEDALRIGCGFGGGMARQQEVCGAVTGAYMVIGAQCRMTDAANTDAKERTYALVNTFAGRFREAHGTTICLDLLGCDLNTEEGQREVTKKNLAATVCLPCVHTACRILDSILSGEPETQS